MEHSALELYSIDHSLYCAKTRLVLRHKGLEWRELPPPDGPRSPRYLALVPDGNLPALRIDGMVLTDSEVINEYLNDRVPEPPMHPDSPALIARARQISRFSDTRLEPALRSFFAQTAPAARDPARLKSAHADLSYWMAAAARLLDASPLALDRLWLADCGLIVTLEWIALLQHGGVIPPLPWPAPIQTYHSAKMRLPTVTSELRSYRPHMVHWMREKGVDL